MGCVLYFVFAWSWSRLDFRSTLFQSYSCVRHLYSFCCCSAPRQMNSQNYKHSNYKMHSLHLSFCLCYLTALHTYTHQLLVLFDVALEYLGYFTKQTMFYPLKCCLLLKIHYSDFVSLN